MRKVKAFWKLYFDASIGNLCQSNNPLIKKLFTSPFWASCIKVEKSILIWLNWLSASNIFSSSCKLVCLWMLSAVVALFPSCDIPHSHISSTSDKFVREIIPVMKDFIIKGITVSERHLYIKKRNVYTKKIVISKISIKHDYGLLSIFKVWHAFYAL